MIEEMIESGGMRKKAQKGAFTLYTHLSWTGRLVLGEEGAACDNDALELCPELNLGSIGILIQGTVGVVANARADNGQMNHLAPPSGHRLLMATISPVEFTSKAFRAIASAMIGGDEVLELPEVQSANARNFIARLHNMGIGDPPRHIL